MSRVCTAAAPHTHTHTHTQTTECHHQYELDTSALALFLPPFLTLCHFSSLSSSCADVATVPLCLSVSVISALYCSSVSLLLSAPWKSTGCRLKCLFSVDRSRRRRRCLAALCENCVSQRANPALPLQSRITSLLFASVLLVCLLWKSQRRGRVLLLDRGYFIHRVSAE